MSAHPPLTFHLSDIPPLTIYMAHIESSPTLPVTPTPRPLHTKRRRPLRPILPEEYEEDDDECFPPPPHLAQSSKNAICQMADNLREIPLDPLLTPNNSLNTLLPQKNSPAQDSIQKPIRVEGRSRSIFNIPDQYRDATARAAAFVRYYTFFENPMLNPNEIAQLVLESWVDAIQETGQNLENLKVIDSHKLHSIHSRTRAHLVYECKKCIIEVYKLNHLPQAEIADNVEALLFQNRFICCQDGRETNDISGSKKLWSFFDSINEVFICLVTSAMRHCLKGWTTGIYEERPKSQEFKYETTIRTYKRFLATWEAHSPWMRNLLLATIKADLCERLIATQPKMDLESDQALTIDDSSRFEQELI
ncbi:hypothetical protein EV426DRAFT_700360 [Tirmania nivea]|nr:hypothetical protein EV426DRAFT_700360 [Tirmania nivea]